MPNTYQGDTTSRDARFGIVVSRYNDSITESLLEGAQKTLLDAGVAGENIDVAWVPGAFEIPVVAYQMAASGRYAAVLCLGAVIRGETTHDQHINCAVSVGITEVSLRTGVPCLFGVLTCESVEQAIHRSGGNMGNKGVECAHAAVEIVSVLGKLPGGTPS